MKTIKITNSTNTFVISDEDFERVTKYKWYQVFGKPFRVRKCEDPPIELKKYVTGVYFPELDVRYKDGNRANLQRENLYIINKRNGRTVEGVLDWDSIHRVDHKKRWLKKDNSLIGDI